MALTGQVPEWVPEDVFSPRRLLCDDPLFMQGQDSLWRISTALCRQMRSVNHQIAEHLNYTPAVAQVAPPRIPPARMRHASRTSIAPAGLQTLPAFRAFTLGELAELLRLMRMWDAAKGSVVCEEGSPGGTCFVVLCGSVDVSIWVRGQQQLLAKLIPGDIFGQISLIDGEPRSATCTARSDAVLGEMASNTCLRLFKRRSQTALKFLGALTHGIILALRGADGRLLRLNGDQVETDLRAPHPNWPDIPPFEFDPYPTAL
jgi:hypothetical protein